MTDTGATAAPSGTLEVASGADHETNSQINGADMVIKALQDQDVEIVFGYPGGAVLPIYDALFQQNHIRHILVRHEQAAVHAAEGYARSTGKVGVVLVTSGPGATNAVTGLTDALLDSIPLVCLTGQVPTHLIGNDAFQEADTTGITRPCTKHNYLVKKIEDLPRILHEAFYVARTGRPGPVVIDLPKDIVQALGTYVGPSNVRHRTYRPNTSPEVTQIDQLVDLIAKAERPIFYGGGGLINSGPAACEKMTQLVNETGFPCTLTLMGLGAVPASNPHYLGMLGMHGLYESNMAMHGCDLMINIGARFDDRVTGDVKRFSPNSTKVHIDIDPSSINKNVMVDLPIVADCEAALDAIIAAWTKRGKPRNEEKLAQWWTQIRQWQSVKCLSYEKSDSVIKPQYALERLQALTKDRETYITTEVGQHQMWAAQFLGFERPNQWMTSGGLGTMGYGFPAAVGVQLAHPDALVIDVAGEASIQMNIQEMATATQYRLPVKIFVLNNRYMGMVRQWQQLLHGCRYSESYSDALPDFIKLAEAYGWRGLRATTPAELDDVIQEMMDTPLPVFVDVAVEQQENCFPMIPSGCAHNEMILSQADVEAKPISDAGRKLV